MVIWVEVVEVDIIKSAIKTNNYPQAVMGFTLEGMVIPSSVEVVVDKGNARIFKISRN